MCWPFLSGVTKNATFSFKNAEPVALLIEGLSAIVVQLRNRSQPFSRVLVKINVFIRFEGNEYLEYYISKKKVVQL